MMIYLGSKKEKFKGGFLEYVDGKTDNFLNESWIIADTDDATIGIKRKNGTEEYINKSCIKRMIFMKD